MPALHDLQSEFRRFILGEQPAGLLEVVEGGILGALERLSLFRNNFVVTHTTALSRIYPVVESLVDSRFFAFAAHEFLRERPPRHPCLSQFGGDFPDFLATFTPAASLPYIADVARLEWAISRVVTVDSEPAIPIETLATSGGDPAGTRLFIDRAVHFLTSAFPVDVIWRRHQPGSPAEEISFAGESVYLQVGGAGRDLIRRHTRASWHFLTLLAADATLGRSVEVALDLDPDFKIDAALAATFADGLVIGLDSL